MANVQVRLLIAEDASYAEVLARVVDAGLSVETGSEALGFVVGRCEESAMSRLGTVPGVLKVERGRGVQLPDPSSPVQ
jgi:hypothetical protein